MSASSYRVQTMNCLTERTLLSNFDSFSAVKHQLTRQSTFREQNAHINIIKVPGRETTPIVTKYQFPLGTGNGQFSLGHSPFPARLRLELKVGLVGLGLVGLVLGLRLGLWFGLGGMYGRGNVGHSSGRAYRLI